jgi:hypothetical protein
LIFKRYFLPITAIAVAANRITMVIRAEGNSGVTGNCDVGVVEVDGSELAGWEILEACVGVGDAVAV